MLIDFMRLSSASWILPKYKSSLATFKLIVAYDILDVLC